MNFGRSALRYAHTTGFTSLIYTDDDSIFSCGNDGDLRKWRSIDDDDPISSCLGEFVVCLAQQGDRLLASTDRNTVQAYKLPDIENDGVLMRFTATVTCLFANEKFIAAGSEDTNIKVQRVDSDNSSEGEVSVKHSGPILSLDISPVAAVLASIGGDGQLKIWDLDTGTELKSISGLVKVNSFESASCYGTPVFEPINGKVLAYVRDKEICILNTSTWEVQCTLVDNGIRGNYTCCRFSSDGRFLAAGTTSGEISVFDFLRKEPLKSEGPSSECQAITCLSWRPRSNQELAYCDASGQLGILFANESKSITSTTASIKENAFMDFDDIEFENNDDDNMAYNGVENNGNDADNDNDDDGISIEKIKRSIMNSAGGNISENEDTRDSSASSIASQKISKRFKQQSAFQPSSTPSKLEHRYLVWNDIGIVTGHSDGGDGSIDVEFHDASIHHALHIPNLQSHDMASLSSTALALSTRNSSKLVCISLAAAGNKEWTVEFPDCESVEAVAASSKLIAVATNSSFLRLFTVMGTQREVISIPGPVLSVTGFEDRILLCYHSAPPTETHQYISAMFLQVQGLGLKAQQIPIPLPSRRQMAWLGFSDCGSPVFADSMGLIQLYSLKSSCWYPICDTLKQSQSVSNNYFVISVSERQQIIQAVLCRGCAYPMTNPRPMVQELPMHISFCDPESDKSNLEDTLIRANFMSMDNADSTIKETAVKLFAIACRSENETRAKELIEAIGNSELLQLAVKYATKLGRVHLSERLYDLMTQMQQEKTEDEPAIEEIPSFAPIVQQSNTLNQNGGKKLAPKAMDLTHAKRATLKRFSSSPTPSLINKKFSDLAPSSNSAELDNDSQENLGTESIKDNSQNSTLIRTPFNSVNPFATKRKLDALDSDVGQKGILLGANKLKIAKK